MDVRCSSSAEPPDLLLTSSSPTVNQARAIRVAEIINDFRNIQHYLASIRANPSAEEYNEEGFALLRKCIAEAQALLSQPFHAQNSSRDDEEQTKVQLRR